MDLISSSLLPQLLAYEQLWITALPQLPPFSAVAKKYLNPFPVEILLPLRGHCAIKTRSKIIQWRSYCQNLTTNAQSVNRSLLRRNVATLFVWFGIVTTIEPRDEPRKIQNLRG